MAKQTYSTERKWYAVHTYSGYEDAVARNLKQRIESYNMSGSIFQVIVPAEKKIKIKNGRKTETREKIYPGYVLVDMIASDDAWSVVRNTPQVSRVLLGRFLHRRSPQSLSPPRLPSSRQRRLSLPAPFQ